jgi:hypothetical protein
MNKSQSIAAAAVGKGEKPSDRSVRVAKALAALKGIVLPYPRQQVLMAELDELRLIGLETMGEPQNGLRLLSQTMSGKTVTARQYVRFVEGQPHREEGHRPVLIVPLEVTGTPRSLFSSILTALGDDYSCTGTEQTLKKRVLKAFEIERTELLIIDEVQHLNHRLTVGNDVTDTLKRFLDDGVLPVAFLGTDAANDLFRRNPELNGRLAAPCSLPPLDWNDEEDQRLFTGFALKLDEAMVEKQIFRTTSGFAADEEALQPLFQASNGVIGQLVGLIRTAARDALRRDDDAIQTSDLSEAVDRWSIPHGFIGHNPFQKAA